LGKEIAVTWELRATNGKLSGIQKREDGVTGRITGERAPALHREPPKNWGAPEALFNGKDLTGWQPDKPSENHWRAQNGELVNEATVANIRTIRKFNDFKLHIDYNCPQDGNSGVYLRDLMKFRSNTSLRIGTTSSTKWDPFTGSSLPR
jgi:hypothetical protein